MAPKKTTKQTKEVKPSVKVDKISELRAELTSLGDMCMNMSRLCKVLSDGVKRNNDSIKEIEASISKIKSRLGL